MRFTVSNLLDSVTAIIASGASISGDINLGGMRLFAIQMPSAWTAANLTFQVSFDQGSSWTNLFDALGNEYVVTAGATRTIVLDPTDFAALPLVRIRSGTSTTAVTQAADRSIGLILRSI